MKNRMVLWSRGHFKTSAVVLKIVQLILAYPIFAFYSCRHGEEHQRPSPRSEVTLQRHESDVEVADPFSEFCNTDTRMGNCGGFRNSRPQAHPPQRVDRRSGLSKSVKTGQITTPCSRDDLVNGPEFRSKEQQEKRLMTLRITRRSSTGGLQDCYRTRYTFRWTCTDISSVRMPNDANGHQYQNLLEDGSRANGPLFPQVKTKTAARFGFTAETPRPHQSDDRPIFSCHT